MIVSVGLLIRVADDWHRLNNSIANFFRSCFLRGPLLLLLFLFVCLYVCLFVFFNNRVIIDFRKYPMFRYYQ